MTASEVALVERGRVRGETADKKLHWEIGKIAFWEYGIWALSLGV